METFKNIDLLEPAEIYKMHLKDAFHNNAEKAYEEMDKEAKVDVERNQEACKKYYNLQNDLKKLNKSLKGAKVGRVFCIIFCILLIPIIGIVLLTKKIKKLKTEIDQLETKAKEALSIAEETMKPLNDMMDWNMAAGLMSQTTPLIQLDQVFDARKYEMLHEKYGYEENNSTDTSAVYVQSGAILGNPFIFEKNHCQTMRMHRYTGTRVVSYTVSEKDSNGRMVTRTRTETLTASLDKEEPAYYYDTTLILGNEAAPDLIFSRSPCEVNSMDEKKALKYIEKFDEKLDKKASKAIKKGESFTRLGNEEFEARFQALDRNNELQFRLLFTPLAQKNMIRLLTDHENGFGDDFYFRKNKKLNYITCNHMQGTDTFDRDPRSLMCFDYSKAKETFIDYCDRYLKDIFFNLAPAISIPLYQQTKTREYIYHGTFKHNVTKAEAECAANAHDVRLFAHPSTRSAGVILKSDFIKSEGKADVCNIRAHSFEGITHVDYVPTMAGNGRFYDVPVEWIEYLPISKDTRFVVQDTENDLKGYRALVEGGKFNDIINKFGTDSDTIYKKRIFSFVPKDK